MSFLRAVLIAAAAALVAFLLCFLLKPSYRGYETLYFPMSQGQSGAAAALGGLGVRSGSPEPGAVQGLNGAVSSPLIGAGPQTAIGILTSRSSIDNIIQQFGLTKRWNKNYSDTFHKVETSLSISTDKDSGFVKVAFESTDKALALDVVRKLLDYLTHQGESLSINVSRKNREFVESRLELAKKIRAQREREMIKSNQDAPLASSDELQKDYMTARSKLGEEEAALAGARAKIAAISTSLNRLYSSNGTADAGIARGAAVAASDALSTITKELTTRRLLLEDAMSTYRNGAAEVARARSDYENAQRVSASIGKSRKAGVTGKFDPAITAANGEVAELEATVEGYKRLLAELNKELTEAPAASALEARLKADENAAQEQVTRLEQEVALARIAEERDPSRFEVVDKAAIDPDFSSPKKGLIAAIVFALVLVAQGLPYLRKLVVFDA